LAADIRDAGTRAADLTRQLLAFSRRRFVAPAPLDLNAVVAATANLLRRLLGGNVELVTVLDPDLPAVTAETGLIEQILLNLAVNARDAMPEGGMLTIRTERAPTGAARLTVSDDGVGMPPDVQARVFEPFFTTKPVGQGTGLGLATVYGAVQTLGGAVRFSSAVGRGTTFEIDLPAADGSPPPSSTEPPDPASSVRPATVLLVDDEDAVRALVRDVLTGQGMTVLSAADGPAALNLAAEYRGAIDVLVSDVRMPQMSGWDLAARVQAARPEVKVVLMSGYAGADTPPPIPGAQEWAFLQKPFTPADLTGKVRDVLRPPGGSKLHAPLPDGSGVAS
jgi:CheY-like chemotaxis protein